MNDVQAMHRALRLYLHFKAKVEAGVASAIMLAPREVLPQAKTKPAPGKNKAHSNAQAKPKRQSLADFIASMSTSKVEE